MTTPPDTMLLEPPVAPLAPMVVPGVPRVSNELHRVGLLNDVEDAGAIHAAQFLRSFFAVLVLALVAVMVINWYVDPLNLFGHPHLGHGTWNDRESKVNLVRANPNPDFVILGTSRVQKYDPTAITKVTGAHGWNLGVAASQIRDATAFTAWLAERADKSGQRFPHVIYGISPESFVRQSMTPAIERFPELKRNAVSGISKPGMWQAFSDVYHTKWRPSLTLGMLNDSYKVARNGNPKQIMQFHDDGYMSYGYFDWSYDYGRTFEMMYQKERPGPIAYYTKNKAQHGVLPASAKTELERLLRIANAHGDQPTLFVPPTHPRMAREIAALGSVEHSRDMLAYIDSLHAKYQFTIYSFEDLSTFGGSSDNFYDGVHPRAVIGRAILARIAHSDAKELHPQHS